MGEVSIKDKEPLPLKGILSINLEFEDGTKVPFFSEEMNVIMDAQKARLLAMVYDTSASLTPDPILTYRVGDGGTLDGTVGPGGIPGVNPKPVSGSETALFNEINPGLYSSTALSHTLENATVPTAGTWAGATSYSAGDIVGATDPAYSHLVFEALTAGNSGGLEPEWPLDAGSSIEDNTVTWLSRPRSLSSLSVTYSFSLSSTELNSYNVSEVALYTQSANIFNIKTFPSIPKSAAFSIQFLWTIMYV